MKRFVILVILLCCLYPCMAAAQNPFVDRDTDASESEETETRITPPPFLQKVPDRVVLWQKHLREGMSTVARDIRDRPFGSSFWLFLALSFAYGVVHAVGPGHGKTVVASYFLNRPGTPGDGILMSFLIALFHVGSATVIIMGLYAIFQTTGMNSFEEASPLLQRTSYALLFLVGLFLFSKTIYELVKGNAETADDTRDAPVKGGVVVTALATGIVPCPGAAIILSFTIIIGIPGVGLVSMLLVALGMGLTVSVAAVVTILSRRAVFRVAGHNRKAFVWTYGVVSIAGSLLLMSLSGLLFLYYLG
jgi:ABC-type nickel/cobalt efflux system permease component RcnA